MLSENEIIEVANTYLATLESKIGEPLVLPQELMIKKIMEYTLYIIQKNIGKLKIGRKNL